MRFSWPVMAGGIGSMVGGWVLPMVVHDLPPWVRIVLLAFGVALIIFSAVGSRERKEPVMGDTYNNNGNNFGHMGPVNIGKGYFALTDDHIRDVLSRVPAGQAVELQVIGNDRCQRMGLVLEQALRRAGHPVEMVQIGSNQPMPERPLEMSQVGGRTIVVLAPDV